MKAIINVVAILVIGGAAFLTLQHHSKFQQQQGERLKTIDTNRTVSASADATETDLKKEVARLNTAENKKTELTQSLDSLKSDGATKERDLAEVENTLKGQDDEFVELNKAMDQVKEIVKGLGNDVTLDNLGEKIQVVTEDRKQKELAMDELTTNISTAEKKLADVTSELDRLMKRDLERNSNIARNAMEAMISSVDQDWGFVVIGAGSNSGFAPQSTLIIKRDGQVIGRLQPSSIEPSQTIAEIDFASLSPGVRIQPGDRVIPLKPFTR